MQVITALLVDEVRKHPEGGVDLLGLFEDIYLDEVPVKLESISMYVDLALEPADKGVAHTVEFSLVAPDGKTHGEATKIRFSVPPHVEFPRDSAQLDLVLFEQTFMTFGTHHVEIRRGDQLLRRVPLHVSAKTDLGAIPGAQSEFDSASV
ncbi:MAG: hypothetical protein H8F28_27280 [Fibrella sp.]|nr:hypothetical protein [Armatimonadota bacterium]